MGRVSLYAGRRMLRGFSLLETVVASAIFLFLFAMTLGMLPRLTICNDDALLVAEAMYRVEQAFDAYAEGRPIGTYIERYEWGDVTIRVEPYRNYSDVGAISIWADLKHSRKRIVLFKIVERRDE